MANNTQSPKQEQEDDFYAEFETFLENPSAGMNKLQIEENKFNESKDNISMQIDPKIEDIPLPDQQIHQVQPVQSVRPLQNNNQEIIRMITRPPPPPPTRPPKPASIPEYVKIHIAGRNPNRPINAMDLVITGTIIAKIPCTFYKFPMAIATMITMSLRNIQSKPPYNWAYEAKVLEARDPRVSYSTKIGNTIQNKECYPTSVDPTEYHQVPTIYGPDAMLPHPHAKVFITFALDFGCLEDHRRKAQRRSSSSSSSSSSSTTSKSSSSSSSSSTSSSTNTSKETHKHESEPERSTKRSRSPDKIGNTTPQKKLSTKDLRFRIHNSKTEQEPKKSYFSKIKPTKVNKKDPFVSISNNSKTIKNIRHMNHKSKMYFLRKQRQLQRQQ